MRGKVVAIHRALRAAGLPHAFGGALALASYAEPRPTRDIDVNVFVPPGEWPRVRAALHPLGIGDAAGPPEGDEVRLPWDGVELHLFFSSDPLHAAMPGACREVPLGGTVVPLIAPEHLVVRKAILGREKDRADIAAIRATTTLDEREIERWLGELGG